MGNIYYAQGIIGVFGGTFLLKWVYYNMFGNIDIMHKVIQWYMRKHEECTRDHASVFENIPIMYQGVCYFFWGGDICYPSGSMLFGRGGLYVIQQEVYYM